MRFHEDYELPMYGPGKFEGQPRCHADVHELSLCGADESVGDGDAWADLLVGGLPGDGERTADEDAYLASAAGWIIYGDAQGFVTVERYEDEGELRADWAGVVRRAESLGNPD